MVSVDSTGPNGCGTSAARRRSGRRSLRSLSQYAKAQGRQAARLPRARSCTRSGAPTATQGLPRVQVGREPAPRRGPGLGLRDRPRLARRRGRSRRRSRVSSRADRSRLGGPDRGVRLTAEILVVRHELAGDEGRALRVAQHRHADPRRIERRCDHVSTEACARLRGTASASSTAKVTPQCAGGPADRCPSDRWPRRRPRSPSGPQLCHPLP